jgi:erythromycin esterase-like protein
LSASCEQEVVAQLTELRRRAADYAARDGRIAADDFFFAEQNARLVKNAEEYYRTMFHGRVESWNLRDQHMADTLNELLRFLDRTRQDSRVAVWAHNSHLGDARATEMGRGGELNVGQLARERFGAAAFLVGFTTHTGTVTAASEWDGPAERRDVRPSLTGSYERLFHEVDRPRFLLHLREDPELAGALGTRLERAIGVIYLPQTERRSHYFDADIADQFDAVIHIDLTQAVQPLEWRAVADDEVEETFPSGL